MDRTHRILLSASVFSALAAGMLGPIYAVYVEHIGGDLLTAGGAYAVYAISTGLLILLFSRWEDRVRHLERLVVLGNALSVIGYAGYLFVRAPWQLFILQVLFGVALAIGAPAYDSIFSRTLPKNVTASSWGWWEAVHWTFTALAALIGGAIATWYGFSVLFTCMLVFSIVTLLISTLLLSRGVRFAQRV